MTSPVAEVWVLVMKGPQFLVAHSVHQTPEGAKVEAQHQVDGDGLHLVWDHVGEESWETRTEPGWLYQIYPRKLMD